MRTRSRVARLLLVASVGVEVLGAGAAAAQGVPSAGQAAAQSAHERQPPVPPPRSPPPPAGGRGQPEAEFPVHPWELPALEVEVTGEPRPALREEERVGSYGQPRWTARRRFPTTRIYVVPAGRVAAEYWLRGTFPFEAPTAERELRSFYELELGLGHRLQLDMYLVTQQEGHGDDAAIELKREQVELRYALADWGKIWGNPTIYLEYQFRNGGHDWLEGKILLGGQIAPGWHAGLNLVLEKELGGSAWENEYAASAGLSYTLVDDVFHIGVEGYAEGHDFSGDRFDFGSSERMLLGGPSFLVSPVAPVHLLFAPLFGAGSGGEADMKAVARLWFVAGWTF
ncbi:MAG: hypothetical protein HY744_16890 [Deltaproteobacteria bacterium]|nr:hypothetical protein [Deltaproteobacteria bacterium]